MPDVIDIFGYQESGGMVPAIIIGGGIATLILLVLVVSLIDVLHGDET
jgi:hypothetical protein